MMQSFFLLYGHGGLKYIIILNSVVESDIAYPVSTRRKGWQNVENCGVVQDRIVGGQFGQPGDFPWLVALKLR